jgi:hypothetical protein
MKKQWLVNLYRKGQARVDDRSKLDDAEHNPDAKVGTRYCWQHGG